MRQLINGYEFSEHTGLGAIYYTDVASALLQQITAALFEVGTLAAFVLLPRRRRTLLGCVIVWTALLVGWITIKPSNDRDWQPEVCWLAGLRSPLNKRIGSPCVMFVVIPAV